MTRASLLQILDHVTSISEAETRELEQLAATFPYCQTAHLLLAKAAHDHGSMLASQRLRHAATYAADRQLLRELIERQPAPAPALAEAVPAPAFTAIHAPEVAAVSLTTSRDEVPVETSLVGAEETVPDESLSLVESPTSTPAEPEPVIVTDELIADDDQAAPAPEAEIATGSASAVPEAEAEPEPIELTEAAIAEEDTPSAELPAETAPASEDMESEPVATEAETTEEAPETTAIGAELLDDLPAVAPPIRPPADAGSSRFEYGFTEPEATPVPVAYELPELEEKSTPGLPAFYADAALGYGLAVGSRLGYALEARSEASVDLPLAAFFEPDALLLEHAETHKPAAPPAPTSFELINRFLKSKPRLKSPALLPPPADEQQDLSVRSTSIVPELASESLAKIMVKQGKVAKAIEIYERLMVRQPEKKAYFADQIHQLKPSE